MQFPIGSGSCYPHFWEGTFYNSVGTKDVVALIHFVFFIFVISRDLSLDFGARTSVAYAYLQDLEGYCRDPGFDRKKVRDSIPDLLATRPGSGILKSWHEMRYWENIGFWDTDVRRIRDCLEKGSGNAESRSPFQNEPGLMTFISNVKSPIMIYWQRKKR